ncbi:MAG: GMC family oxidoreductase N-terminal domain-containing protein [Alphaproteobacteria bacterium]
MHDYIVVGAGSAGCVVANRLSAKGARVLLLEAGGDDDDVNIRVPAFVENLMDSPHDWGYRTVPQAELLGRKIFLTRGRCLGGTSSMNFMVYMRGNRGDYDHWRQLGNQGWGYDDVLPYFVRSETNGRYRDKYHGTTGPLSVTDPAERNRLTELFMASAKEVGLPYTDDANGATQEGYGYFQATKGAMGRCNTATAFLRPVMSRQNLTVVTHALTTRLIVEKGRAIGVEYLHDGRQETAHAANEVVLCGGAINSPQLLLLSGIGPADELRSKGIGAIHDLPGVGKNLHDHLYAGSRFEAAEPLTIYGMSDADITAAERQCLKDGTGPFATNYVEAGAFVRLDSASEYPDVQMHFALFFMPNDYFDGTPPDRHGYLIAINVCRPRSRGDLRLHSSDPLDRPLIDPRYLSDPVDLDLTVRGLQKAIEICGARPFSTVGGRQVFPAPEEKSDKALINYIRRTGNTVWHPVGTCKMGHDPMAVVDDKLRVHGIAGLRVADASIMPEIVSSNTNAPCIMIGEKASDLVLGA